MEKYVTMTPKTMVVDIHKKKGKRPDFDIYMGRRVKRIHEFQKSSKWGNPYSIKKFGKRKALELFEKHIRLQIEKIPEYYNLSELVGNRLGCWCITTDKIDPIICHVQIIMKIMKEKGLI